MRESFDPAHTNETRMKREREKARELKASRWWQEKIASGTCGHCGKNVGKKALTMDHIIPLARGGESIKNNVMPACLPCNQSKQAKNPLDDLFARLSAERDQDRGNGNDGSDQTGELPKNR